jgi:hypothetical protein
MLGCLAICFWKLMWDPFADFLVIILFARRFQLMRVLCGAASHYCAITRERLLCRLNLTDPRVLTFFNVLRALNTTGTASGQQVVSYKQLNSEAAILLTSVSGVPSVSGLVNYSQMEHV